MTPTKSEVEKMAKVLHGMHYHPSAWAVELESLRQDFRKMARFVLRRESRIRREVERAIINHGRPCVLAVNTIDPETGEPF
jgi:hypothetical protein